MTRKKSLKRKPIPATYRNEVRLPQDWDRAVSCAYLIQIGQPQTDAATAAGAGVRTLRRWMKCEWWQRAEEEARRRWLRGVESGARRGVLEALSDPNEYAAMSRWAAERVIPEMAPPRSKVELTGKDGGNVVIGEAREKITGAITRLAAAIEEADNTGSAKQ